MNKFHCNHIMKDGKRCGNKRNAHAFTDPSTFTCEKHGSIHTTLPEKDIVAGNRLAEAMTNNTPTTEEVSQINNEATFKITFIGAYRGYDRKVDEATKVVVHGKHEVAAPNAIEAVKSAWDLQNHTEGLYTIPIGNALGVDPQGMKRYFRMVDEAEPGTNIRNGLWHWEEIIPATPPQLILVSNGPKCIKCLGSGVFTWGNVNTHTRHGMPIRGCFMCGTTGVPEIPAPRGTA